MIWSLLLHVRLRPYKDRNSNIAAILFCLCDILGALSGGGVGVVVEITFIVCTLATIITIGVFMFRAIRTQAASLRSNGLSKNNTNDIFAMYTPLEKKLLFPVLAVVWVCVKLFRKLSAKGDSEIALTKVVPEKNNEVKEENADNEQNEQKTTENADETIQQTKELEEIFDSDMVVRDADNKEESAKKKARTNDEVRNWSLGETSESKSNDDAVIIPLSDMKTKTIKSIFAQFDSDSSGSLDSMEVRKAWEQLGCSALNDDEFDSKVASCDKNADGLIDFKEFKKSLYVYYCVCYISSTTLYIKLTAIFIHCFFTFYSSSSSLFRIDIHSLSFKILTLIAVVF